jgi:hypothetical protein
VEGDIHRADLLALALPAGPPELRERLAGTRDLEIQRVALLSATVVAQAAKNS